MRNEGLAQFFRDLLQAMWRVFTFPFRMAAAGIKRLASKGWRLLAISILAFGILLVITATGFFEVTSQPEFCGSCHLMRPYIEAWKHSSHSEIHCMKCHAGHGLHGYFETKFTALSMLANYATGLYKRSRPWAEIDDASCLTAGCHETRLLEGRIEFTKGIVFDHTPHLTGTRRGRKLRCTSCHSQIVQGEHISVTSSTCFLCHFKNVHEEGREELSACTMCHEPPVGEIAGQLGTYDHTAVRQHGIECTTCHQMMWQGTGSVSKERCGVCHSEVAHLERIDDHEFLHEWHVEKRKVDCERCHTPIEHHKASMQQVVSADCRACHEQQHAPMLAVYGGTGSRLVDQPMPNIMHESGAVCMSCHRDPLTGNGAALVGDQTCTPCHEASYLRLAHEWRRSFAQRISMLEEELGGAGRHRRVEDARHDLALLKRGGPWHNPRFADAILAQVQGIVHEAAGTPLDQVELPERSGFCVRCHRGIAFADVQREWSPFDHRAHLQERAIPCQDCHRQTLPEEPHHGRLLPAAASCAGCHHGEAATGTASCEPCHEPSRALYLGKLPGRPAAPSPMAAEQMACTDCHDATAGFAAPGSAFCLDCHDQEVVDDLEFQRGELSGAL